MLDKKFLEELQNYIEENQAVLLFESTCKSMDYEILSESLHSLDLETFIKEKRQPVLQEVLFKFIDKKGLTDAAVYKKALLDRRHFSKIRSNPDYRPSKNTVIALAMALELNKKETDRLLSSAGYSLSDSDTTDLVIQFFLEKKIYDLDKVNQALDYFSQKPLGGAI